MRIRGESTYDPTEIFLIEHLLALANNLIVTKSDMRFVTCGQKVIEELLV